MSCEFFIPTTHEARARWMLSSRLRVANRTFDFSFDAHQCSRLENRFFPSPSPSHSLIEYPTFDQSRRDQLGKFIQNIFECFPFGSWKLLSRLNLSHLHSLFTVNWAITLFRATKWRIYSTSFDLSESINRVKCVNSWTNVASLSPPDHRLSSRLLPWFRDLNLPMSFRLIKKYFHHNRNMMWSEKSVTTPTVSTRQLFGRQQCWEMRAMRLMFRSQHEKCLWNASCCVYASASP